RVDGRAHGERLAVAVGDRAAMRGDFHHAREVLRRLALEEAVVAQLQVHGAPRERRRAAGEEAEQQIRAPAERARFELFGTAAGHGPILDTALWLNSGAFMATPARCPWAVGKPCAAWCWRRV